MNQKAQKPTLTGQRIKTRKRGRLNLINVFLLLTSINLTCLQVPVNMYAFLVKNREVVLFIATNLLVFKIEMLS